MESLLFTQIQYGANQKPESYRTSISLIHRWSSLTVILRSISKNNLLNKINRQTDPGKSGHQQTGKWAVLYDKSLPPPCLASIWHLCSSHFSNLSFAPHMHITSWIAVKFLPSSSTPIPFPGPIKHPLLLLQLCLSVLTFFCLLSLIIIYQNPTYHRNVFMMYKLRVTQKNISKSGNSV